MKKNTLENVIHFIFKYIWIFFSILVMFEFAYTIYTANLLMKQSADGMLQSVCEEVSGRVDGVLRLIDGLSNDKQISDTSKPLYDRAVIAEPFRKSYGLFMIAVCDEDVNVVSSDETEPPAEPTSLAYRDYMQKLYSTGTYQITDAFVSGADHSTMNYTIAVPIKKDNEVKGCVFGSIYFDDIQTIINRTIKENSSGFYLIGSDNVIMAGDDSALVGKSFLEATEDVAFFKSNASEVNEQMTNRSSDSYWELQDGRFWYVSYQPVQLTQWTLVYRVQFTAILQMLVPGIIAKLAFYLFVCTLIYVLGPKYLRTHLADVNHLLNRMASMQKELFQTESTSYDNLLDLTTNGLTDQLTGLATRSVLLKKSLQVIEGHNSTGVLMFIDLDNLKWINDNYGHEGGDCALIYFADTLKKYEKMYNGIAARYGGDEFIFIIENISEPDATVAAEALCTDFNTVIQLKDHTFKIHGSIGLCTYPWDGTTLEDLICKADLALYSAKRSGKNQVASYSDKKNPL